MIAWPLCVVNGRVTGDTDINPVRLVAIDSIRTTGRESEFHQREVGSQPSREVVAHGPGRRTTRQAAPLDQVVVGQPTIDAAKHGAGKPYII